MRSTHTFAVLKVSQSTYDEIREKLQTAAYDHAFHENGIIDMHGIALQVLESEEEEEDESVLRDARGLKYR